MDIVECISIMTEYKSITIKLPNNLEISKCALHFHVF